MRVLSEREEVELAKSGVVFQISMTWAREKHVIYKGFVTVVIFLDVGCLVLLLAT